jgi:hypothetical protein
MPQYKGDEVQMNIILDLSEQTDIDLRLVTSKVKEMSSV